MRWQVLIYGLIFTQSTADNRLTVGPHEVPEWRHSILQTEHLHQAQHPLLHKKSSCKFGSTSRKRTDMVKGGKERCVDKGLGTNMRWDNNKTKTEAAQFQLVNLKFELTD